jgi:hypothetical protein
MRRRLPKTAMCDRTDPGLWLLMLPWTLGHQILLLALIGFLPEIVTSLGLRGRRI